MNVSSSFFISIFLFFSVSLYASHSNNELQHLSGGQATIFSTGTNAFSLPSANMPLMQKLDFNVGNSFFRNPWVVAPASTDARDGLGPLMNTNGCQNCHIKDGRGHAPQDVDINAVSLLLRLSIPESENNLRTKNQAVIPDPTYGGQLQDFAIPGIKPEGQVNITYTSVKVTLNGGEVVELRRPQVNIDNLAYGALHPDVRISARIAPPMIGLGLLEAISSEDLLRLVDEHDQNNDGISGRVNLVWDQENQRMTIGRFGWKAGQPSLRQQNAAAFNGDLGLTSSLFSQENCTEKQKECLQQPTGSTEGGFEVSENILNMVTLYSQNLAVPARRDINNTHVQYGQELFDRIGCAACHQKKFVTSKNHSVSWLANQTIYPYTDLLLHDMGDGLADHADEFSATGREWRTPPLWGIGLAKVVSKEAGFLHDGRARTLQEAILWHGGEAKKSQQQFSELPKRERSAILAFLNSL